MPSHTVFITTITQVCYSKLSFDIQQKLPKITTKQQETISVNSSKYLIKIYNANIVVNLLAFVLVTKPDDIREHVYSRATLLGTAIC